MADSELGEVRSNCCRLVEPKILVELEPVRCAWRHILSSSTSNPPTTCG